MKYHEYKGWKKLYFNTSLNSKYQILLHFEIYLFCNRICFELSFFKMLGKGGLKLESPSPRVKQYFLVNWVPASSYKPPLKVQRLSFLHQHQTKMHYAFTEGRQKKIGEFFGIFFQNFESAYPERYKVETLTKKF